MNESTKQGTMKFRMEKNRLVLEFDNYNGLIKDVENIEDFIKTLKKEVIKFNKWKTYKEQMDSQQLTILNEDNGTN